MAQKTTDADLNVLLSELIGRTRDGWKARLRRRMWLLTVTGTYRVKRFIDLFFSTLGLLVLSPLFIVLAVLIKLTSKGPIVFSQYRVGRYGRHFRFYKFRSMYIDAEQRKAELLAQNQSADGVIFKMKNDPRITPVGRWLRKLSLDELPQLINVFLGDMSLVGPRPPVPSEVREYSLEDRKRLNVVPGITCLWQISGRSEIPFHEQVRLDKAYIRNHGFWSDTLILLKTIPAILTGRGAY